MTQATPELADYLPRNTITLTGYNEAYEAIRSPHMRPEPLHHTQEPLAGESVMTLTGAAHIRRRRIMNALVRPSALTSLRENVTLPTVLGRLSRLEPDTNGVCSVELVSFLKRCFVEFACAMIGLVDSDDHEQRRDSLAEVSEGLHLGFHAKWMHADEAAHMQAGLAAKTEYASEFYLPALRQLSSKTADTETLLRLLAEQADPAWNDEDTAIRESMLLLIGTVETSAMLITHAVHELDGWFAEYPEDRKLAETDVEFLGAALQEALRLNPVLPHIARVATEDFELSGGRKVRKGQWVVSLTAAANQDKSIFGSDAAAFNPRRILPPTVPRYGIGFGAGPHQCLGLRIVLGNTGAGSHAYVLRELYRSGVRPDPLHPARTENSDRGHFDEYYVTFARLAVLK
jgi:cytochrome P450